MANDDRPGSHARTARATQVLCEDAPAPLLLRRGPPDWRYHTWAIASRFLDAAAETHWQDSAARLAACRLAPAIAERLPIAAYLPGLTHDLLARALAGLADAPRPGPPPPRPPAAPPTRVPAPHPGTRRGL